jgi:hypothetical protein
MKGDVVIAPDGQEITLVDIGLVVLLDNPVVRVWDVALEAGGRHSWHQHHNPYAVLSILGSDGRMDWLDGSAPRFISEYRGGAVYRPVSPVHRLTNLGDHTYQNRLVEFKDLGEYLPAPLDIGVGARSIPDEPPGPAVSDGRHPVIDHPHVRIWTLSLPPGERADLDLADVPHVVASLDPAPLEQDSTGGVTFHGGGSLQLANDGPSEQAWFLVELTYLDHLIDILNAEGGDA